MTSKGHKHTVSAIAARELRRRIMDGSYGAGLQLRQDTLAAELGVSRIPVREALMQLQAEGLVTIRRRRGAIVSKLSEGEIDELFELRATLEPRLLALSACHLRPEDYRELRGTLSQFSEELRARNVGRWGELNRTFHLGLYKHANRPRTVSLVGNLLRECDLQAHLQLEKTGSMPQSEIEHAAIVDLCEANRTYEACDLLRRHIENVATALRTISDNKDIQTGDRAKMQVGIKRPA